MKGRDWVRQRDREKEGGKEKERKKEKQEERGREREDKGSEREIWEGEVREGDQSDCIKMPLCISFILRFSEERSSTILFRQGMFYQLSTFLKKKCCVL